MSLGPLEVPSEAESCMAVESSSGQNGSLQGVHGFEAHNTTNGSFRKLGVPYLGVLIIRILLFRVLY